MNTTTHPIRRVSPIVLGIVIITVVALFAVLAYRLISGKPLGLRSFVEQQVYLATSPIKALADSREVKALSDGSYTNILFIHQSVGAGFIRDGHLRDMLSQKGYSFWDQGYSHEGLRDPNGTSLGYTYSIPNNDTDPDELYTLFTQKPYQAPINGISQVLQHEVIIFKSCYPNNNIRDEQVFEEFQSFYLGFRNTVDQHPDRLFILLTTPPLNPARTDAAHAARARAMADWLKSDEFQGGRENLVVYDLFDDLAEPDLSKPDANMLRESYRVAMDSHPNAAANEIVAENLADFIDQQITAYRESLD